MHVQNHRRLLAVLLGLTLLLGGCASTQKRAEDSGASAPLPTAAQPYDAPVGDAALDYTALVELYLPSVDGTRLLSQQAQVTLNHGRHPAEAVLRALMTYEGNRLVRPLGDGVQLQLAGVNPVEISCGVCTVTLASTAMQLSHEALYTVCQAMAATLAPYGLHTLNVLISGRAVAMDITATLPLGSVTAHPESELPALWRQLEARRPGLRADPEQVSLSAAATLFFPTQEGTGLLAEPRDVSFAGQTPEQLAWGLISALSAGPQVLTSAAPMPDISSLLRSMPTVTELPGGGREIRLHFAPDLAAQLKACGVDMAGFLGSVTYTLSIFLPRLAQVVCFLGDEPLMNVLTAENRMLTFPDGVMSRSDFAPFLRDVAMLYFVRDEHLVAVPRPVPYYEARNPRYLLLRLMDGPTRAEGAAGLVSLLPAHLGDADMLGFSVRGDELLCNLSASFAAACQGVPAAQERLMAYSIINTLCDAVNCRRVRFFFGSLPQDTLAGSVWWNGSFLRNTSMVQP